MREASIKNNQTKKPRSYLMTIDLPLRIQTTPDFHCMVFDICICYYYPVYPRKKGKRTKNEEDNNWLTPFWTFKAVKLE